MTNGQYVEFRRTFNLGDYETVNLTTCINAYSVGLYEFYSSQIALIDQALELFECRKISAKQAFNNKLADFCEKQETQLMKEKELLVKKLSYSAQSLPPFPAPSYSVQTVQPLQTEQPLQTVDSSAPVKFTFNNRSE